MVDKYTGKEVIRAGEALLDASTIEDDVEFQKVMDILSFWRFTHEAPLETALSTLRKATLTKDQNAIFAKRLKRYVSIAGKLRRFPDMKLKNMQDIGGCRTIVTNTKKVFQVAKELKKMPEFKSGDGNIRFKDYINKPKDDGYRGYHLVGKFGDTNSQRNIELQIRTKLQHDWATTVEIVDLFTGQALKSNQGDRDWKEFFLSISQQFAMMDESHLFETLDKQGKYDYYQGKIQKANPARLESFKQTKHYADKLDVVTRLQAYAASLKVVQDDVEGVFSDGYVLIEVDIEAKTVKSTIYSSEEAQIAEENYVEAEKRANNQHNLVVALVSTTAIGGIREAYPNYFADSTDFVIYLTLVMAVEDPSPKSKATVPEMFRNWALGQHF